MILLKRPFSKKLFVFHKRGLFVQKFLHLDGPVAAQILRTEIHAQHDVLRSP